MSDMRIAAPFVLLAALLAGCSQTGAETVAASGEPQATAPKDAVKQTVATSGGETPANPTADVPKPAGTKLVWAKSVEEANKLAAKDGKFVVLKFEAEWCGPCQLMKKEAFNDPAVVEKLKDAVIVSVDTDKRETMALQQKYQVSGIPRLVFTDSNGKAFGDIMGYNDVPTFQAHLDRALAGR